MQLVINQTDLERKLENAVATRLKHHDLLAKLRMRRNSEDSPRVNQDLVLSAKRGQQSPPFSGIYEMEVTLTLSMRHRRTVDTLPAFLATLKAIEEVISFSEVETETFGQPITGLAAQLSLCVPDFHCYEFAVSGKDDAPVDNKHNCIWTATAVCAAQSYALFGQPVVIQGEYFRPDGQSLYFCPDGVSIYVRP